MHAFANQYICHLRVYCSKSRTTARMDIQYGWFMHHIYNISVLFIKKIKAFINSFYLQNALSTSKLNLYLKEYDKIFCNQSQYIWVH